MRMNSNYFSAGNSPSGKASPGKSKGRELEVRGLRFPENWILRYSDLARFDVFLLRQRQRDNALVDFCADLISVDRWVELERAPIILRA
jgi:hypothetical protein